MHVLTPIRYVALFASLLALGGWPIFVSHRDGGNGEDRGREGERREDQDAGHRGHRHDLAETPTR